MAYHPMMTDPGAPEPSQTPRSDAERFACEVDRWLERHIGEGSQASPGTPASASLDRLMALLDPAIDAPIDAPDAGDRKQLLINVTYARVRRAKARSRVSGSEGPAIVGSLGQSPCDPASAGALDRLVEGQWSADDGSTPLAQLLALIDTPPAGEADPDRARRIDQTMKAVRADLAQRRRRMKIDPESVRAMVPPRSFRLADVVSIAAMLLIGIGVLWPVLVSSREQARTAMCASGMQQAGVGMGLFARDHDGRLPATALVEPDSRHTVSMLPPLQQAWWHVGTPGASHSANFFVVVRLGYTHLAATACPGNEHAPTNIPSETLAAMHDWANRDQMSYSYQLFWGSPPRLGHRPEGIILSDRSPVVDQALRGEPIDFRRNSDNHGHLAQNALRQDGRVDRLTSPILANGDNIWLPAFLERDDRPVLRGTELPWKDGDVFLGP